MSADPHRVWEVVVPYMNDMNKTLEAAISIAMFNPEVYPVILAESDSDKKQVEEFLEEAAEQSDEAARVCVRIHRDN